MAEIRKNGKIVVGYDLGNITSQISYCYLSEEEPETISTIAGMEQYNIPTVLCKRKGVNQWFYGKEAEKAVKEENGVYVRNLLKKARLEEKIEIEEENYPAAELLALFVKRSFGILSMVCPTNKVEAIVITVDEVDAVMVSILEKVAEGLPIQAKEVYFQSKEESFFSYVTHQEAELWTQQVLLCDITEGYLRTFRLEMNKKTRPMVAYIDKTEFSDLTVLNMPITETAKENFQETFDKLMLEAMKAVCGTHMISTIYLIGDAFLGEWCKETLRFLCQGKRVFQGNNLYSKGACYLAKEKQSAAESALVFLGNDKLKANIGTKLVVKGEECYYALLDAGQNWYEASKEIAFILQDGNEIELIITPLNGRNAKTVKFILDALEERPPRTTRIKLSLQMKAENLLQMKAEDMGFGELFPTTGKEWMEEIEIA